MKKFYLPFGMILILSLALVSLVMAGQKPPTNPQPTKPASVASSTKSANVSKVMLPASNSSVPQPVHGVYSTAWIAGSSHINEIISFIKQAHINTLVIDVKDDTGYISYPSSVPLSVQIGSGSDRVPKMKELVARLKQEHIYTIARIVVFKDPLLAKTHPEIAVLDKNGGLWHDRKGMTWVDPNNRKVWEYNVDIAKEAVAMGFSEVQFDYVRFLSDGLISNCVYPYSKGQAKEDVIHDFLSYAKHDLNALGVPVSADIFGLVLTVPDDLNIGQKLEKIATAVDYISPMVYPSHYPKGTFGIAEPNQHPYEVIANAMRTGTKRLAAIHATAKLRPWLQDFNLGYPAYGKAELQAQIKALQDNGVTDWLFWNPSNKYDPEKY